MNDHQLLRYCRHILLDEVGIEGQEKLLASRVLMIGAGGLGCPAALYLGSAGVGRITVIDDGYVELGNLQRQIAHSCTKIGQSKAQSVAQSIEAINPDVVVHPITAHADAALLSSEVPLADVVLDCSDNFATRQAINHACVTHRKPLVSASATGFEGQICVYNLRQSLSACYACVFPLPTVVAKTSCATTGVFAPLVGIMGSMQAAEALKLLCNVGATATAQMLMLDVRTMRQNTIKIDRHPGCPVCA